MNGHANGWSSNRVFPLKGCGSDEVRAAIHKRSQHIPFNSIHRCSIERAYSFITGPHRPGGHLPQIRPENFVCLLRFPCRIWGRQGGGLLIHSSSYAPMSQLAPCGRVTPRWSVVGQSAAFAASIAGLPGSRAWVWVGPPLSASGAIPAAG